MHLRALLGDASAMLAGNVASLGLQMALGIVLARALGPAGYGLLSLVVAATGIAFTVLVSWVATATIRFGREERERTGSITGVFWLQSASLAGGVALGAGLLWAARGPIDRFCEADGVARAAALYLAAFVLLDHGTSLLQAAGAVRRSALLSGAERAAGLAAAGLLWATGRLDWLAAVAVLGLARLAAFLLGLAWLAPRVGAPRLDAALARRVLDFAWPLLLWGPLGVVARWGNLLLVQGSLGVEQAGLYAVGNLILSAASTLPVSVYSAVLPALVAKKARDEWDAVERVWTRDLAPLALLASTAAAAGVLLLPPALTFLFGEAYRGAGVPAAILLAGWGACLAMPVYDAAITAAGRVGRKVAVEALAAAGLIALALWAIPRWGIAGAAAAATAVHVGRLLLFRLVAASYVRVRRWDDLLGLPPALAAGALVALAPWWLALAGTAAVAAASAALLYRAGGLRPRRLFG